MDKILIYNSNEKIFIEKEYNQTAGNNNSVTEMFQSNRWINPNTPKNDLFIFDTPLFTTVGGVTNYYGQEVNSVFTNIARPFICFTFTANTGSLSADTTLIQHNIYRIDYNTYLNNISKLEAEISKEKRFKTSTIEKKTITAPNGEKNTTITEKEIEEIQKEEDYQTDKFYKGRDVSNVDNKFQAIIDLLEKPILTITAHTNTITSSEYNLFLEEYFKNLNSYKQQLFLDKSQYFITTNFRFIRNQGGEYNDFYKFNENDNILYPYDFQNEFIEETPVYTQTITAGTFSGVTVKGNFFTYFLIPNKPIFQKPIIENQLTTYSPTFFFDNVDDGDEYLLQVNYVSGDSQTFSGTVYTYVFSKEETMLNKDEIISVGEEDWETAKKRSSVTRKISASLKPNKQFWYRIGNKKIITNLFGVKQSVVSFSDIKTAITSQNPLSLYVGVESDSPYVEDIVGLQTPDYLDLEIETFSLSGIVSGSIVTGATLQIIAQNGNYITQTTNTTGFYNFTELESGDYTLKTFYRGYQQDTRSITITGNTSLSFKLKLLWGNDVDTWGKMANENYYL